MMPIILDRKVVEDIGGSPHAIERDMFGLEIELEGRKLKTMKEAITKYWSIHPDGSLRVHKPESEALEYVFNKPYNMEDTKKALAVLYEYLNTNPGTEVFDSYRTSIHVHVNCLQDTVRTVMNFLTLSIIFDELFVSQNGERRIGNNFCLRAKDAEGQIADIIRSVTQYGSIYNLSPNDRYSAINFSSLIKFGTVEFRSLECTLDYKRVMHWIKTLQALKEASRQYENPREIISKFSRRGPLGFIVSHLGEQYEMYAKVPGAHQMLHNGMRLAQDFAFCSDWRQPEKGEIKPPSSKRKGKNPLGNIEHYQNLLAQINQENQGNPIPAQNVVNHIHWEPNPPQAGVGGGVQGMQWHWDVPAQPIQGDDF